MNEQTLQEKWQVEVGGQIYEAAFGELSDWIFEGSLLPEDKVRKGNLRWIEARRVPYLIPFFNAKAQGLPNPVVVKTTNAEAPVQQIQPPLPPMIAEIVTPQSTSTAPEFTISTQEFTNPVSVNRLTADPNFCITHRDIPSALVCRSCNTAYCKACPRSYGGSVKICPACGDMCSPIGEAAKTRQSEMHRSAALAEGFGIADFFTAIAYPWRFKTSLFLGAVMFMIFTIGQSVSAIGGIFMIASALFCFMLANMLTFGVLAHTVDNFSQGRIDVNFMPDYENFELWGDVIHPFFLSIGVYLVSFGPFFLTMIIGAYLVLSSMQSQMQTYQSQVEKVPGTHYYDAKRTMEQSEDVKALLGEVSNAQRKRVDQQTQIADGDTNVVVDEEARAQEELWEEIQESRKAQLESTFGKTPETQEKEFNSMVIEFLSLAAPLVVIGAIFFLWGAFYISAACAVAGYTRSFIATINPLVGLDTIKRLGLGYVKILLMGLVLVILSGLVSGFFALVFSPFDLPGMGNLPAKAIGALFGFYLSVVFSCILGYALFKNSDKLQLLR